MGQVLKQGDLIGQYVVETGHRPHLHWGMNWATKWLDPATIAAAGEFSRQTPKADRRSGLGLTAYLCVLG